MKICKRTSPTIVTILYNSEKERWHLLRKVHIQTWLKRISKHLQLLIRLTNKVHVQYHEKNYNVDLRTAY